MGLPIVPIIGRPNLVGKSTLVNRLAKEQSAIVYNELGVKREITYMPVLATNAQL